MEHVFAKYQVMEQNMPQTRTPDTDSTSDPSVSNAWIEIRGFRIEYYPCVYAVFVLKIVH